MMRILRRPAIVIALAASFTAGLVVLATPAGAHGDCDATGEPTWVTSAGNVKGQGHMSCDNRHYLVHAEAWLQWRCPGCLNWSNAGQSVTNANGFNVLNAQATDTNNCGASGVWKFWRVKIKGWTTTPDVSGRFHETPMNGWNFGDERLLQCP